MKSLIAQECNMHPCMRVTWRFLAIFCEVDGDIWEDEQMVRHWVTDNEMSLPQMGSSNGHSDSPVGLFQ